MVQSGETATSLLPAEDETPPSMNENDKTRKHRYKGGASERKSQTHKDSGLVRDKFGSDRGGKVGSVLWTILLVGLLFSLVDVVFMLYLMDKHEEIQNERHAPLQENKVVVGGLDESSKEAIFNLLRRGGVNPSELDAETVEALPSWEEVVNLYGAEPIIHGLDQCDSFQGKTERLGFIGTAGTFNSGTNLMAELLIANCHMQSRMDKFGAQNRGIRWQVPWGKHTPPSDESFRKEHKTYHDTYIDADSILPVVTIRDPLTWLISMCHHHYAAKWDHPDPSRCPDFSLQDLKTTVKYAEFRRNHESILHLWNDYYREYLEVPFPRLIVRIEDLIFHPEKVTTAVCKCAGGSMREDGSFKYIVNSAKKGEHAHGKERTGFVDAIIKYGSDQRRYESYKFSSDLQYIRDHLDSELLKMIGYNPPDPERALEQILLQ